MGPWQVEQDTGRLIGGLGGKAPVVGVLLGCNHDVAADIVILRLQKGVDRGHNRLQILCLADKPIPSVALRILSFLP